MFLFRLFLGLISSNFYYFCLENKVLLISNLLAVSLLLVTVVVFSDNLLYSLFSLLGVFLLSSFFLAIFNIEFLSLVYVIVYAGGIAVLFSIVILVLDMRHNSSYQSSLFTNRFYPFFYFFYFLIILTAITSSTLDFIWFYSKQLNSIVEKKVFFYNFLFELEDIHLFSFLYRELYVLLLLLLAFLLLAAMIGSIMLCLNAKVNVKTQCF